MLMFGVKSVKSINFLVCLWIQISMVLDAVDATPLFFASPFATQKPPDGELESISVYTTSQPAVGERKISDQPNIYQQIARNALERIVSPVVSHFILTTATQSSRLVLPSPTVTTPPKRKSNVIQKITKKLNSDLETLDETVSEDEHMTNSTMKAASDEIENKEMTIPSLVANNPSFNRDLPRQDKPERIVLYPNPNQVENSVASEVDDLNKTPTDPNAFSDTHDSDNEVETIGDNNDDNEEFDKPDETPDEDDDETAPEATTPKHFRGFTRNFSESGLIYVLEILGTIYTLGTGLVSALFSGSMRM